MEDDAGVRELVELIFSKQFNFAEMTTTAVPAFFVTNDFPLRFKSVLFMKYMIFNKEWRRDIGSYFDNMLTSHKIYLKCVIFACLTEYKCYQNIFESFISVCAFLKFFNDETLVRIGMDFRDLNIDVFMVLYENVMKSTFYEEGGLRGLVEYIDSHRYLSWKWNWKQLVSTDVKTVNTIQQDIKKKFEKEYNERDLPETETDAIETDSTSIILVHKMLSSTLVELPTFPNNPDMCKSLEASNDEKRISRAVTVFVDLQESSQECSNLNSDSKTDHTINHSGDNAQYENIIQAVIKYNHSSSPGHTNLVNIQKKADGISEHLLDKIKFLNTILDDYDKK